ncbi:immunoglobulin superfamily member 6 isoform X2 [Larimichthys crocea]|uniref:immunoglobulin superfamily member 6 isoform X2 n=1 Tax=Larimichthys crocea TaxID=215358 RepID=UPI000F5DAA11|nr:immunoglobulin superfamily member 6 isoform X2 [Larimichthys crocea]
MISFTCCPLIDMERLFWFSLLLTYLPVTESMENADSCLSQPETVILQTGQSAFLPCTVSSHCSANDWDYEWISFKESTCIRINLKNPLKYSLEGASLHIRSLQANDSGIYYCAALNHGDSAHGTQHVGFGTTLVVRERFKIRTKHILLWLSFVLLAIYSLVILTLIIKKCGCRKNAKTEKTKKTSTKKTQFRDVLQEMYSKRNFERSKQTAGNTDNNSSSDDIYQNV